MTKDTTPKKFERDLYAVRLNICGRTSADIMSREMRGASQKFPLKTYAKKIGCRPEWLADVLIGADDVLTVEAAAMFLNMPTRKFQGFSNPNHKSYRPEYAATCHAGKMTRWSLNHLRSLLPPIDRRVSPLGSASCHAANGWQCES